MHRNAFTLIEMLAVVVVIMILAGMMVSGGVLISRSTHKAKTRTILAALRQGLDIAKNEGRSFSLTPHPLWDNGVTTLESASGVVSAPGFPYVDGMPKSRCGILGASLMSSGSVFAGSSGNQLDPYTYNRKMFQFLFGDSTVLSELTALGAVFTPPDDAQTIPGGRLWQDPSDYHYRLRGMYFYDSWGGEILAYYRNDARTEITLLSGGPDGIVGTPGPDGVYGTSDDAPEAKDDIVQ